MLVVGLVEELYEVPLQAKNLRFERPLAAVLLAAALLVLLARGFLHKRRAPRLLVSRGAELQALRSGWRAWLSPLVAGMRVVAVALLALALMGPQSIHARDATDVE